MFLWPSSGPYGCRGGPELVHQRISQKPADQLIPTQPRQPHTIQGQGRKSNEHRKPWATPNVFE